MTRILPPWQWSFIVLRFNWLVMGFAFSIEKGDHGYRILRQVRLPTRVVAWLGRVTGTAPRGGMVEF